MHPVANSPPWEAHAGPQILSCSTPLLQSTVMQKFRFVPSLQRQICLSGPGGGGAQVEPHTNVPPQPSAIDPHVISSIAHDVGMHSALHSASKELTTCCC